LGKSVTIIAPWIVEMTGQETAKLQHSYEFVKEEGTAEVRQTTMFTGDFYVSR
jgi:hypothetical protein